MTDRLKSYNLISANDIDSSDIRLILSTAKSLKEISYREVKRVPTLQGKTVLNVFFESSTRTRTSFEIAGKRLSADVINFSSSGSSVKKGESLKDTVATLDAMSPDVIVIRHGASGAAEYVSRVLAERAGLPMESLDIIAGAREPHGNPAIASAAVTFDGNLPPRVINAGDGWHEHPSQALLDMFTILENKGKLEGLSVAIVGDIAHSRVARSNIIAMRKMGMNVTLCGPKTLLPVGVESMADHVTTDLREALDGKDAVIMLRLQLERMEQGLIPSIREYSRLFGLGERMLRNAKKDVIILHPGPINRGVEIDPAVADGPYSLILDQVANGIAVRMALLYLLAVKPRRESRD